MEFDLFPAEWIVRQGNRIAVRLSSFDNLFHVVGTQTTVSVADGSLSIPFLRYLRNANLEGGRASSTSPALSPMLTESQIMAAEVEMEFPPQMVAPPTDWDKASPVSGRSTP